MFNKNTGKGKLAVVFDIGSASVGGALFRMSESGVSNIIFSIREPIVTEKDFDLNRLILLTMKSLDAVAGGIHKSGLGAPKRVFCVLSSPWHVSQTREIAYEKNTSFLFTSRLADDLIQKEVAFFKEEQLAEYTNTKYALRLIELKNIKITLNGYETVKPLDKHARKLEMVLFVSMSPEQILSKVEQTIGRYFHAKDIKFSSFMMAFFSIVRDIYPHQEDFLLIDIGGEVTDISMTKKNVLRESISFPLGHNFTIREVATLLGSTHNEARSFISLLKDGHATEPVAQKLNPAIDKIKTKWLKKFQESLANLSNDISIPATIYVSVDKDFANFFSEIIRNEQFNQYTLTESKFKIILLDTSIFHDLVMFGKDVVRDPSLIIDSIYISRFLR